MLTKHPTVDVATLKMSSYSFFQFLVETHDEKQASTLLETINDKQLKTLISTVKKILENDIERNQE